MSTSASMPVSYSRPSRALNLSLWIGQILLALVFTMTGYMKVSTPIAVLSQKMAWVMQMPALVRFIGICELVGVAGLILPSAFKIFPKLTAWAATGLLGIMILAVPYHMQRGEYGVAVVPLLLGVLAAFVAWGRFRAAPIQARA